jgi:hypothetical protein
MSHGLALSLAATAPALGAVIEFVNTAPVAPSVDYDRVRCLRAALRARRLSSQSENMVPRHWGAPQ